MLSTALAGMAMWFPSKIGKGINWTAFTKIRRTDESPLLIGHANNMNTIANRGHSSNSIVTIYAADDSVVWNKIIMMGTTIIQVSQ